MDQTIPRSPQHPSWSTRWCIDVGQRVTRLAVTPEHAGYAVHTAAECSYLAQRVIVTTGPHTTPHLPSWAAQIAEPPPILPPLTGQLLSPFKMPESY